jgi:hypothetical protein
MVLWQRTRWSVLAGEEEIDGAVDIELLVDRLVEGKFSELKSQFVNERDRALKDGELWRDVPLVPSTASSGREALAPSGNAAAVGGVRQHEVAVTVDKVHEMINVAAVGGVHLPEAGLTELQVKELIDEALQEQFSQIVGVFREGFANVVTKQFLMDNVCASLTSLEARVTTLEVGAAERKEGLRRRIDKVEGFARYLDLGLKRLEQIIEDEMADESRELGRQEPMIAELDLQRFRTGLRVGMPVHLKGLVSRPELNGKAGSLLEWHTYSQRWAILIGDQRVLVKLDNIVP